VQAYLTTFETGTHRLSALGDQGWIERLCDHKNNLALVEHGTEILIGLSTYTIYVYKILA